MSLVELSRHMSNADAHILRGRLQAAGVHAVVFDSGVNIVEGIGVSFPVRLMVLDEDLEEARDILAEDASL